MNNAKDRPMIKPMSSGVPMPKCKPPRENITKREHFAAMAMQGLVVRDNFCSERDVVSKMAAWSVACADSLLAELEK